MPTLRPSVITDLRAAIGNEIRPDRVAAMLKQITTKHLGPVVGIAGSRRRNNAVRRNPVPAYLQEMYFFVNGDGAVDVDLWLFVIDAASEVGRVCDVLKSYLPHRFKVAQVTALSLCVASVSHMTSDELVSSRNGHLCSELRAHPDFPTWLVPEALFYVRHIVKDTWNSADVVSFLGACQGGVSLLLATRLDAYRLASSLTQHQLQHLVVDCSWDVERAFARHLPEFIFGLQDFLEHTSSGMREYVVDNALKGVERSDLLWLQIETVARYLPRHDFDALHKYLTLYSQEIMTKESLLRVFREVVPCAPPILAHGLVEAICASCLCDGALDLTEFTAHMALERRALAVELSNVYGRLLTDMFDDCELLVLKINVLEQATDVRSLRRLLRRAFVGAPQEMLAELQWMIDACCLTGKQDDGDIIAAISHPQPRLDHVDVDARALVASLEEAMLSRRRERETSSNIDGSRAQTTTIM
eukprot:PhM_4_TR17064/c0_g1_i1/m.30804